MIGILLPETANNIWYSRPPEHGVRPIARPAPNAGVPQSSRPNEGRNTAPRIASDRQRSVQQATAAHHAARLLGSDAGIIAGRGQGGPDRAAAPSCSGASRGALPGSATLPAIRGTAAAEGPAATATAVIVRYGGVRGKRLESCQCSVTLRTIFSPVNEIMPDCCTPAYECLLAEFGALPPYRQGPTPMSRRLRRRSALLERTSAKLAAVALANKTAWLVQDAIRRDESYAAPAVQPLFHVGRLAVRRDDARGW